MSDPVSAVLLEPHAIHANQLSELLSQSMSKNIDFADIFFQSKATEYWLLEDGIVKEGSYDVDKGFGFRVCAGEKTGFAYADHIDLNALKQAANTVKTIASQGENRRVALPATPQRIQRLYPEENPLITVSDHFKVHFLSEIDAYLRAKDPRVVDVVISLAGQHEVMLVVNTEGDWQSDIRPLVSFRLTVYVEQKGVRESGSSGFGGRYSFAELLQDERVKRFADKALTQALNNLEAMDAPAGVLPVVLGPGWPAVLLHEAVGHGLEGDFNRKGSSVFAGKIGQQVASPLCTIMDDGSLAGRRGSLSVDDEGTPTQSTVLIEKGILKGYLQDKLNARLSGMAPTGNGRRELYNALPMPRMTNTFMLAGDSTPAEIVASLDRGIYAVDFGGGQVDITSGQFVFSMSEAYWVEQGKIIAPLRGATLIGSGLEVMQKISMVGNDLQLDEGIGVCGKSGQSVPVGVGQPTLKIEQITVGGQK